MGNYRFPDPTQPVSQSRFGRSGAVWDGPARAPSLAPHGPACRGWVNGVGADGVSIRPHPTCPKLRLVAVQDVCPGEPGLALEGRLNEHGAVLDDQEGRRVKRGVRPWGSMPGDQPEMLAAAIDNRLSAEHRVKGCYLLVA